MMRRRSQLKKRLTLLNWYEETLQGCAWRCCSCLRQLVEDDFSLEIVLAVLEAIDGEEQRERKKKRRSLSSSSLFAPQQGNKEEESISRANKKKIEAEKSIMYGGKGIEGPLLDILLSVRLREKEIEALRGDERLPAKADFQLKQNLKQAYLHTEKKIFKKRESQFLERLFILYLRIFKSLVHQSPSLVMAVFRGFLSFSSYINEELLHEILLLFRDLLQDTFSLNLATAAEESSSSTSLLSPGDQKKKRKKNKKKNGEEEKKHGRERAGDMSSFFSSLQQQKKKEESGYVGVYIHRNPEVAAMAIATPLLLLHRV
ncbi:hypothetical protein CSUI_009765, partial [Cystoisospora suis]